MLLSFSPFQVTVEHYLNFFGWPIGIEVQNVYPIPAFLFGHHANECQNFKVHSIVFHFSISFYFTITLRGYIDRNFLILHTNLFQRPRVFHFSV